MTRSHLRFFPSFFLIFALFVILSIPAIYYSLNTPFALVDDLTDWGYRGIFRSWQGFWIFFKGHFSFPSRERYRPLYDLGLAFSWNVLGPSYPLHHLERWVKKSIGLYFAWLLFKRAGEKSISDRARFFGFWTFAFTWWFAPNNPESRLAPQELHVGLFFLGTLAAIAPAFSEACFSLRSLTRKRFAGAIVCYVFLSWSKESANALMLPFFLSLLWLSKSEIFTLKAWIRLAPFAFITAWTAIRVAVAQYLLTQEGQFGTLTLGGWWNSLLNLLEYSLGYDFFKVLLIILMAFLFFKHKTKTQILVSSPWSQLGLLLIISSVFGCVFLSRIPGITLRYAYPQLVLWALIMSWIVSTMISMAEKSKYFQITVIVSIAWFVAANYHNFLYQFATQHSNRNDDLNLLNTIDSKLNPGNSVIALGDTEEESKIINYFQAYLPTFFGRKTAGYWRPEPIPDQAQILVKLQSNEVKIPEGWALSTRLYPQGPARYRALHWAGKISRLLRSPRRIDRWDDSGAHPIEGMIWELYERSPRNTKVR